ncbi:hypothetical protein D1646_03810 [Pseudoflavonifractor sp. 60]|uniref:hypothetical protein n=1 Tax=Pseudoflavonifractor sp. 60 TaxID=2304576 RepID=UPI00136ECE78|nr:hypothetical protein [Pseudoflavonifractor sp. 60]NBI65950.1 hypothetical protein [Pseudoflavonifractor sp. 60]
MNYTIKATLINAQDPERGQTIIHFPIMDSQYDQVIEMLRSAELGFSVNRDCTVDEIDSRYSVLNTLEGTLVNVDQLDYLAKRLDSFRDSEAHQFEAMAHKLGISHIKDFINLTFCCQQATVITDFSDLESIWRSHFMNLNGSLARMEELEDLDGAETALLLIDGGGGVITPYGVVYDNGMVLEQHYNGHQFPFYPYNSRLMVLEITPKRGLTEGTNPEYLYLPAAEYKIERALLRVGVSALADARVQLKFDELPDIIAEALDLEHLSGGDIPAFNQMCQAIDPLGEADTEKLKAVVLMTETSGAVSVCQLAEALDQFDFVPGIQTPEEYGRYMIQKSGHFEYDENLDGFYDYRRYGEQRIQEEGGQFNECGYVAYHGEIPLEELMRSESAEQSQQYQGSQMGGLT